MATGFGVDVGFPQAFNILYKICKQYACNMHAHLLYLNQSSEAH